MSYYRDYRVRSAERSRGIEVDEARMIAVVTFSNEDGDEVSGEIHCEYEVCDTCNGKGRHVNPSIDSHGLTREDFDEDPDFRENYFSGMYEVQCYGCKGKRVVPELSPVGVEEKVLYDQFMKWADEENDYANLCRREAEMGC